MHTAIVEATDVSAAHAKINAANFHIGHVFGFSESMTHVFLNGARVNNLALAHAARFGLAHADDV